MSEASIYLRIGDTADARFSEVGNVNGVEDVAVDDDTTMIVDLTSTLTMVASVGQWRQLAAAVERGIAEIPAERVKRRKRAIMVAEWQARQAVAVEEVPA